MLLSWWERQRLEKWDCRMGRYWREAGNRQGMKLDDYNKVQMKRGRRKQGYCYRLYKRLTSSWACVWMKTSKFKVKLCCGLETQYSGCSFTFCLIVCCRNFLQQSANVDVGDSAVHTSLDILQDFLGKSSKNKSCSLCLSPLYFQPSFSSILVLQLFFFLFVIWYTVCSPVSFENTTHTSNNFSQIWHLSFNVVFIKVIYVQMSILLISFVLISYLMLFKKRGATAKPCSWLTHDLVETFKQHFLYFAYFSQVFVEWEEAQKYCLTWFMPVWTQNQKGLVCRLSLNVTIYKVLVLCWCTLSTLPFFLHGA